MHRSSRSVCSTHSYFIKRLWPYCDLAFVQSLSFMFSCCVVVIAAFQAFTIFFFLACSAVQVLTQKKRKKPSHSRFCSCFQFWNCNISAFKMSPVWLIQHSISMRVVRFCESFKSVSRKFCACPSFESLLALARTMKIHWPIKCDLMEFSPH